MQTICMLNSTLGLFTTGKQVFLADGLVCAQWSFFSLNFDAFVIDGLLMLFVAQEQSKQLPSARNFLRRGSRRPYCASKDKMRQHQRVDENPVCVGFISHCF